MILDIMGPPDQLKKKAIDFILKVAILLMLSPKQNTLFPKYTVSIQLLRAKNLPRFSYATFNHS